MFLLSSPLAAPDRLTEPRWSGGDRRIVRGGTARTSVAALGTLWAPFAALL